MRRTIKALLLVASTACAGLTASAGGPGELSAAAQSAVVTALTLVEGYALSNQYVLVQCETGAPDTYRISISVKRGSSLPELSGNDPAIPFAVVETTRREGAKVKYQSQPTSPSGNEGACRAAVAYRAQQGWLPSGFWMSCDMDKNARFVFFSTQPNRWPGDHCTIYISTSGIRFIGGA